MALGGRGQVSLQEIRAELCCFAEDGQSSWRQFNGGSELPKIEELLCVRDALGDGERPDAGTVCSAIESACEALDDEWKRAARAHLGFAENAPDSRTDREEEAARQLRGPRRKPMSARTYRGTREEGRHRGRKYDGRTFDSWSEVTLTQVAEALITQCGCIPADRAAAGQTRGGDPGRKLGDEVRDELSELYQPVGLRDFDVSFFHRASTSVYIENLASLDAVTLYSGGAISGDVRTPLSDRLMALSLEERLRVETDLDEPQRERVVGALMHSYPPAFLGSITREYVRAHSDSARDDLAGLEAEARSVFAQDLRSALKSGRDTGGFLALGLGALALAMRKAGRDPVRVMATNYDDRLSEVEGRVHEYFEELADYSLEPSSSAYAGPVDEQVVPIHSLNGRLKGVAERDSEPLVIGEADSLTDYFVERSALVDAALAETSCIFIGTTLTEPDLLTKLVNAPYRFPRFAVVLAPEMSLARAERARALNLMAQRFLHLGVVPIIIDFPHQAPQFLIEVALRLQQGEGGYDSYPVRLERWWSAWARDFGFGPGREASGGTRSHDLQQVWMNELEEIRDLVIGKHLGLNTEPHGRDEQIQVEVWLRHPDLRSLVLWATSENVWLNAHTAHRCSIHEGEEFAVQRAFREGTPVHGPISRPRGIWRYQMSIPLVLRKHPWYHLPVGVISILSSKGEGDEGEGGRLGAFAKRDNFAEDLTVLVSDVKRPVNELLDPTSERCRGLGLGDHAATR